MLMSMLNYFPDKLTHTSANTYTQQKHTLLIFGEVDKLNCDPNITILFLLKESSIQIEILNEEKMVLLNLGHQFLQNSLKSPIG